MADRRKMEVDKKIKVVEDLVKEFDDNEKKYKEAENQKEGMGRRTRRRRMRTENPFACFQRIRAARSELRLEVLRLSLCLAAPPTATANAAPATVLCSPPMLLLCHPIIMNYYDYEVGRPIIYI
eukprot:GHVU01216540.1.p1 GENE.GHVU01216540.1~~GHVU01216540.1.p1  ORF type:complete len:124 (+),score=20.80 GHVU01216540.1:1141-1512(+)